MNSAVFTKLRIFIGSGIYFITLAVMLIGTVLRCVSIYSSLGQPSDFDCYWQVAEALCRGVNPYNGENLILQHGQPGGLAPIVFPAQAFLLTPFVLMSMNNAEVMFYFINLVAAIAVIILILQSREMLLRTRFLKPSVYALGVLMFLFVCFNSFPVFLSFRTGQLSIIVTLLTILSMRNNSVFSGLLLSIGLALKISLPLLFMALMLSKRQYRTVLFGCLFLVAWSAGPVIFGHNLIVVYSNFLELFPQVMASVNSWEMAGTMMTHFGYFQHEWVLIVGKCLFLLLFFKVLYVESKTSTTGLSTCLLVLATTMTISYHRPYDLIAVVPLLGIELWDAITRREGIATVIGIGSFMIYFIIPLQYSLSIAFWVGGYIGPNSVIYFQKLTESEVYFPLTAVVTTLLTLWLYKTSMYGKTARAVETISISQQI